jgi:hypothetical protein
MRTDQIKLQRSGIPTIPVRFYPAAPSVMADTMTRGASRAEPNRAGVLQLAPLGGRVEFEGCPAIEAGMASILSGWTSPDADISTLLARIERTARSYKWIAGLHSAPEQWTDAPPQNDFDVIYELQFELVDWLSARNPRHFCLHCAAVEIGGGLIVFPSPRRAGKSTLTMQLAQAGYRVWCDDALHVEPERQDGVAPGILPRLRLPIARSAGRSLRDFVDARPAIGDADYRYVGLRESELAPCGAAAPIRALVVLDRVREGEAALEETSQGEMLKLIIARNATDRVPAAEIFRRMFALTQRAQRFRLRYARGADAVALLRGAFDPKGGG